MFLEDIQGFSSKTERIFFDGEDPTFGSKNFNAKIKNEGDLLGDIFIRADITATCSGDNRYTVNHFGNSLIKKVDVLIGKNIIDTQRSPWFQIYDELYTNNYEDLAEASTSSSGGKNTTLTGTDKFTTRQRVKGDQPLFFSIQIHLQNGYIFHLIFGLIKPQVCICLWYHYIDITLNSILI